MDRHVREGLEFMAKAMHETLQKSGDPVVPAVMIATAAGSHEASSACSPSSISSGAIGRAGLAGAVNNYNVCLDGLISGAAEYSRRNAGRTCAPSSRILSSCQLIHCDPSPCWYACRYAKSVFKGICVWRLS